MRLRWQFTKFKMDEGRFTKAISEKLIDLMLIAAREGFKDNFHKIPVWTGESRGGMRETARALGLEDMIDSISRNPRATRKRRRYRKPDKGAEKNVTSAESNFVPPRRVPRNRVEMFIKNEADGFFYADKRAQKNTGPWKFSAGFSRSFRKHLKAEIAKDPGVPVKNFAVRQRALVRG